MKLASWLNITNGDIERAADMNDNSITMAHYKRRNRVTMVLTLSLSFVAAQV